MVEAARKRRNNTSVSQEDYLKAIWEMEQEEQEHISARLSEVLGVTPPAVTAALKRMARNGTVRLLRRGQMRLTSKGREIANHLILRHRLAEKLLSEVLGMPWTRVHDEAEKLEHAISPEVEGLLLKYFGRQSSCPHGNPLSRGVSGQRRQNRARRLSEMQAGQRLEIQRVYEKESGFLEYLDRNRLRPGTRLLVEHIDYDQTMQLLVAGKTVHLGRSASDRIWVKPLRG